MWFCNTTWISGLTVGDLLFRKLISSITAFQFLITCKSVVFIGYCFGLYEIEHNHSLHSSGEPKPKICRGNKARLLLL